MIGASTVLFLGLTLTGIGVTPATSDEIAAFEAKLIESRLAIKKWHMRMSIRYPIGEEPGLPVELISMLDDANQRFTTVSSYDVHEKLPGQSGNELIIRHLIWGQFGEISWGDQRLPDGGSRALEIDTTIDAAQVPLRAMDVRWVGWHEYGIRFANVMTDILQNADFVDRQLVDDVWNGVACKKLSFVHKKTGHPNVLWVSPEQGYSVLEYYVDYKDGATKGRVGTIYKPVEWKNTGIWYPKSWVHQDIRDGSVGFREEVDVEIVSLNEHIPVEHFQATALNVPIGTSTYIKPNPDHKNYIWDGKKPVEVGLRASRRSPTPRDAQPNRRLWLLGNAFALTLISTLCLWKAFGRKKGAAAVGGASDSTGPPPS